MVVTFKEENLMTFKHLFLKNYVDGVRDTYAVYRQDDVYDHIDYIIEQVTVLLARNTQTSMIYILLMCCKLLVGYLFSVM